MPQKEVKNAVSEIGMVLDAIGEVEGGEKKAISMERDLSENGAKLIYLFCDRTYPVCVCRT